MSASANPVTRREEHWSEEATLFESPARRADEHAGAEFLFKLLGPLEGRQVLDVGCGDGLDLVTLARMGARVTGIDVSPGAVAAARRRAGLNGVSDRVSLVCAPIQRAALPAGSFDVVWGAGILHRVQDDLERVLGRILWWAKPNGLLVFSEPPLPATRLELLRGCIPDLVVRHHSLLARLDGLVLGGLGHEPSSLVRRAMLGGIGSLDRMLLSLPFPRTPAGAWVMWGHPGVANRRAPTDDTWGRPGFGAGCGGSLTPGPLFPIRRAFALS